MSFWSTVGDIFTKTGNVANPALAAFDMARAAGSLPEQDRGDFIKAATNANPVVGTVAKGLTSAPVQNVLKPIVWTMNQADHALTAGWNVGDIAEANGGSQWTPLHSAQAWEDAWNATGDMNIGQAIGGTAAADFKAARRAGDNPIRAAVFSSNPAPNIWSSPQAKADFDEWNKTTAGRVTAGAIDILATWYADPTLGVGKVAKAARAGSRIVDSAHADEVANAITDVGERGLAGKTAGAFSKAPTETASRLYNQVAKTDNMSVTEAAAHFKPFLERSGDSAPIVGILGQAGSISDVALQRAVKADTLLAAAGSDVARARLIQNAPDIARALQRSTLPPEQFKVVDDMVASGLTGQSLLDATQAWGTAGNKAELKAYAESLDSIHAKLAAVKDVGELGGVESVSPGLLGVVKQKYRAGMARELLYNPGPSGRMVRAVHWAADQRFRGVIDTANPERGHAEAMDVMLRAKTFDGNKATPLFSAEDRQKWADKWWTADSKEKRASMAHALTDFTLAKLAQRHDLTRDEVSSLLNRMGSWRQASRIYTTKAMEEARATGAKRVELLEPVGGMPTSIDTALYSTHIDNSVPVVDVMHLERLVREAKNQRTLADKVSGSVLGSGFHTMEAMNDIWRTYTLGRPGFIARTQFDTQARSLVALGATAVVANAIKGAGYKVSDMLHPGAIQKVFDGADEAVRVKRLTDQAAGLRQQAASLSGPAGDRLLARADALEKQAATPIEKTISKQGGITAAREHDLGNGVKASTRAAGSDLERELITPALYTGEQSVSQAILRTYGKLKNDLVANTDNWVTYMPDSNKWASAWVSSKNAMMQSPTGRKIIESIDLPNADFIKALREDAGVRAEWRQIRDTNPDFDAWLDRAIAQAEWTAPTAEVRKALLSGRMLHAEDAEAMFAKADDAESALPARMPVHSPELDPFTEVGRKKTLHDHVKQFVAWMADVPDTVLGRVPFYASRYHTHFQELARREVDRTGVLGVEAKAKIEKVARHRAIMDSQQTMYDTARFTGAHDRVARMGFAFLGAWEDSMRAWGRLFYDDPSRIGKLTKTWYAPDRAGLIVDESGNPVKPGQDSREKWLALPLNLTVPEAVPLFGGAKVKEFKLRKDSFNSMFQGQVPWAPGFSPVTQVPVTQLAARVFPEIADENYTVAGVKVGQNPLLRQMFGFGVPKTGVGTAEQAGSVAGQLVPGWMKRLEDIFDGNSQQFSDAYAMGLNSALIKARQDGKDVNTKAVQEAAAKQASGTARSMMFMEFISNFGLGLSGEGATKADFYRERYREISANADALKAKGTTVQDEFNRQHPEAAGLKWSFTQNDTEINATLKVEDRSRKYGKDISKNPEFGWFYVGSDNIGGDFSSAVYSSQYNREGTPGSGEAWRSRQNPAEIRKATNASLGWDSYNAVSEKVNLILADRGLHSLNQKGAEDLKQIKANFRDQLGTENPDWFKDYSDFDESKMDTFLNQVAKPALSDGRLKNRSDIKAMGDYLELRQKAMDIANANGYSLGSQKATNLRDILAQAGQQMAADNLGFSQMWTRMFSREIDD